MRDAALRTATAGVKNDEIEREAAAVASRRNGKRKAAEEGIFESSPEATDASSPAGEGTRFAATRRDALPRAAAAGPLSARLLRRRASAMCGMRSASYYLKRLYGSPEYDAKQLERVGSAVAHIAQEGRHGLERSRLWAIFNAEILAVLGVEERPDRYAKPVVSFDFDRVLLVLEESDRHKEACMTPTASVETVAAFGLSRPVGSAVLFEATVCEPVAITKRLGTLPSDALPMALRPFRLDRGVLRRGSATYMPEPLRAAVLYEYHDTLLSGGHMGFHRTLAKLQRTVFWPAPL
ncbi:hypothetical protein HDU87_001128 [Geranomyces variabilis]|uniref:Integrase zinc-binding domain-containing protein n=1 Tax=Geranomyces variabilis TaxID=109894 RepID=A0AAD5XPJ3_9FUNG|nr:hypothetical protein HDU87_001128 [Geranomyces variabilis]